MNHLKRTSTQWGAFDPVVTAQRQSRSVVKAALVDAKHDIMTLHQQVDALRKAVGTGGARVQLNPADQLPPVACPLLIDVDGRLVKAERTEYVQHRGQDMVYRLTDGSTLLGRFPWTYP